MAGLLAGRRLAFVVQTRRGVLVAQRMLLVVLIFVGGTRAEANPEVRAPPLLWTVGVGRTIALPSTLPLAGLHLLYQPAGSTANLTTASGKQGPALLTTDRVGDYVVANATNALLRVRAVNTTGYLHDRFTMIADSASNFGRLDPRSRPQGAGDEIYNLWSVTGPSNSESMCTAMGSRGAQRGILYGTTTGCDPTGNPNLCCGLRADHNFSFFREPVRLEVQHVQLLNHSGQHDRIQLAMINPYPLDIVEPAFQPEGLAVEVGVAGPAGGITLALVALTAQRRQVVSQGQTEACNLNAPGGVRVIMDANATVASVTVACNDGKGHLQLPPAAHQLSWASFAAPPTTRYDGDLYFHVRLLASAAGAAAQLGQINLTSQIGEHGFPAVLAPIADASSVRPLALGALQPRVAEFGVLDLAAEPFNADGTGHTDSAALLSAGLAFAHAHYLQAFLPAGVYRVEATVTCVQWSRLSLSGYVDATGWIQNSNAREMPCLLRGEDNGTNRTRLVVPPTTPFFQNTTHVRPVVSFWSQAWFVHQPKRQPNIHYNQVIETLDIEVGPGNPAAVAIDNRGAQGAATEDVNLFLADDTYGGLFGLSGSGGANTNVTVYGGKYGLDGRLAQPGPSVSGMNLIGQRCASIIYSGLQALSMAAMRFAPANDSVPAIVAGCPLPPLLPGCDLLDLEDTEQECSVPTSGQLGIVDSLFENAPPTMPATPASNLHRKRVHSLASSSAYIQAMASVFLKNVWVADRTALLQPIRDVDSQVATVPSLPVRVRLLVEGQNLAPLVAANVTYQYNATVHYNHTVYGPSQRILEVIPVQPGDMPTFDALMQVHGYGPAVMYPSWLQTTAVNVRAAPFEARGDGLADDTAALQQAIDYAASHGPLPVVLPRGIYNISRQLTLPCGVQFVGVAHTLSHLVSSAVAGGWHVQPTDDAMLRALPCGADGAARLAGRFLGTVISHVGLHPLPRFPATSQAILFDAEQVIGWTGHHVMRQTFVRGTTVCGAVASPVCDAYAAASQSNSPSVLIRGAINQYIQIGDGMGDNLPRHRHWAVANSSGPVRVYHLNAEHTSSETNSEIHNSSNVLVVGIKCEGGFPALWVSDSQNVTLTGAGGNNAAYFANSSYPPGFRQFVPSLFRVTQSQNYYLANLVDYGFVTHDYVHTHTPADARYWDMALVCSSADNSSCVPTAKLERPALLSG
ncbi:uncharacterized protein MONBRDRAFT_7768 [Monosiga brevicollis MX1]|uniref:Rhamnogalacturonase A/B/Epimerase-like pectate lyase domain-containing protein n=1 Tax=Monosiga brevicollis TaxID=81824 RepID=A9UY96_MONBE|nr:uncharacterized protein MONBRDRAFT_7768 [Monosiga brevicollis MX1]EDQ89820.1 predicted protein [Monosiga brevicollis MX1]|eukprot:XP_001745242.1 hypothetical protein [Monosiga brevicollis MX1]